MAIIWSEAIPVDYDAWKQEASLANYFLTRWHDAAVIAMRSEVTKSRHRKTPGDAQCFFDNFTGVWETGPPGTLFEEMTTPNFGSRQIKLFFNFQTPELFAGASVRLDIKKIDNTGLVYRYEEFFEADGAVFHDLQIKLPDNALDYLNFWRGGFWSDGLIQCTFDVGPLLSTRCLLAFYKAYNG